MSAILKLVLVAGAAAAFILGKGPEKVNAAIDGQLEKTDIDFRLSAPTPQPIDQGNEVLQIHFTPGATRETIPKTFVENFRIEAIPGTNEIISIPTIDNTPEPQTPKSLPQVERTRVRNVQTGIDNKRFTGGGPGFIGGEVRETPVTKNSTLSFIINKFGVSASKAASIRTNLRGGLDDFDLGTNTGSGLKGSSPTAIRESRIDKLKAEEQKALQIFDSGSISNF